MCLSGGLDSTTLLYKIIKDGYDVSVLSFDYGQKHKVELQRAKETCEALKVPHKIVKLNINDLVQGSSLTSKDIKVPEGHYEADNMKQTVVPNRNMIMLSIVAGYAVSIGAEHIFAGVHAGDHLIYPDCRKEFIEKLDAAMRIANFTPVTLHAPFIDMTKADITKLGIELNVDFRKTHTCYNGKRRACGRCGSCQERLESFELCNANDPIQYTTRKLIPKQ